MPAAQAAVVMLLVSESAARKRSWRSAVQPSRRVLRGDRDSRWPIDQLGTQKLCCRKMFSAAANVPLGGCGHQTPKMRRAAECQNGVFQRSCSTIEAGMKAPNQSQ